MNDELRSQLRSSSYRLSNVSRQKLRRAIFSSVDRITASLSGETSCSEPSLAESSISTVVPKPPSVGCYGPGPGPPPGTARESLDLSLLGPGEISSSVSSSSIVVAPTQESQGLSLKGDFVHVPNLGTEFYGTLPETTSPPNSKPPGAIPPTAVSIHGESRSSKHKTATGLNAKQNPDASTTKSVNQKLCHCVCGKQYKTAGGLKSHRAHSVPCDNGLTLREAMTVGPDQHQMVPIVENGLSLRPFLNESLSSGINISVQPGKVDDSEHIIQKFSVNDAYMLGNRRDGILPDNVPLHGSDAAVRGRVEVEKDASEPAASPSLLSPIGLFSPPRSSCASSSSASNALATTVSELNHSVVEGAQITAVKPRNASSNLRETQKLFWSEEGEAVSGGLSGEQTGTLPGTLYTNSVANPSRTQPPSKGGEYTNREISKSEELKNGDFQVESLAELQQDKVSVSSCAELHPLPSQIHGSPYESVTAGNNNSTSTSAEVLPDHPKALAQTPLDTTHQSSPTPQFATPSRESDRHCKSGVTKDHMAPNLRPRAPVKYHEKCESPSSEASDSLPPTPADGLATDERQQFADNPIHQSVEQRAGPQRATQPAKQRRIDHQLSDEVHESNPRVETPGETDEDVIQKIPYLSLNDRDNYGIFADNQLEVGLAEGERGGIIHVDFEDSEYEELIQAVYMTFKSIEPLDPQLPARERLMQLLENTSKEDQLAIRKCAPQKGYYLERRTEEGIDSLLQDASQGVLSEEFTFMLMEEIPQPIKRKNPFPGSTTSFLQAREHDPVLDQGLDVSGRVINRGLRTRLSENLACWKTWDDASNDVLVVAWSPNGSTYAVGASAQTDPASAQYNKRNNLLLGDLDSNTLRELPDHHIPRPRPEADDSAQWALYNACDPVLQTSVTATRFSVDGNRMYTASYDHTVKVWDVSLRGKPFVVDTFKHDAEVELAATSSFYPDLLATGSRTREGSIRIYYTSNSDDVNGATYNYEARSSSRAKKHASEELYPSSLQWGTTSETGNYLLAGFSPKVNDDTEDVGQNGEVCLWDLNSGHAVKIVPSSQNVFDAVWHPNLPIFATGSTPILSNRASPKTRSVVRTYEPLRSALSTVEYECPALDINDVTFAPHNVNYISAGCTDGITYVWDYRVPDEVMLQLRHGEPLAESHPYLTREQHDTGVRFSAWDSDGQYMYTGSSDGFIKQWDIRRAAEDVLVRDIVQLKGGVMCGAFSPDHTNLLVGDDTGAIQILSIAPTGQRRYTEEAGYEIGDLIPERIPFIYAPQNKRVTTAQDLLEADEEDPTSYGTMIADEALATGELALHPVFGAGKGPNYSGPYCLEARPEGTTEENAETVALLPETQAQQLDRRQRKKARKHGSKAEKAEVEIIKEQVKLAWLRNVGGEVSNNWGDKYIKEKDETLIEQFKAGKDVVQTLKELRLQNSGGRDADITDLLKALSNKHAKASSESDQDVITRKKSKHRHPNPIRNPPNPPTTHSAPPPSCRSIGNIIIIDDSDSDSASPTKLAKHYDARDAWLPHERNHILFEDAEDSWFISREAERTEVMIEAIVEEAKRKKERERKQLLEAKAAEEKRKMEEARARLLKGE